MEPPQNVEEDTGEDASSAQSEPYWRSDPTAGITPRVMDPAATSSRPTYYMLGKLSSCLTFSKLPKGRHVLATFLELREHKSVSDSARKTTEDLLNSWTHHFGPRFVLGKSFGEEQEPSKNEFMRIVKSDHHISDMVANMYKQWQELEKTSRRPDRSSKPAFLTKVNKFKDMLDLPFNISKINASTIIQQSGLIHWKEEVEYLASQLTKEQAGCPGGWDKRQKSRDERKLAEKLTSIASAEKEEEKKAELKKRKEAYDRENNNTHEDRDIEDDGDFVTKKMRKKTIDVMGKISLTADSLNISVRDRTVMAASVVNALGLDINNTNVSKTSAWRKGQTARIEKADQIKDNFVCPDMVVLHWDGKTLKLRGNIKSNRVCVYLSGVSEESYRKLLGIPECCSGKGADEADLVQEMLELWSVKHQVIGMVFDTTASNSGAETGACKLIEEWLGKPILWLACRRHIAELHIARAVEAVTGSTKDPGMQLYRRLKSEWNNLEIDYQDLVQFDYSSVSPALQEVAKDVLIWAEAEVEKGTFPRDDYREMIELLVISLGGHIENFSFKLPGPDHHARWMAKVNYNLKLRLLCKIFNMTEEENLQVEQITEFIVLFYAKFWFTTPLASAAARNDLEFMSHILEYRVRRVDLSFKVLKSIWRHMWYLTPQLFILALVDKGLDDISKEKIGKKLHGTERKVIKSGRPTSPQLPWGATEARQDMDIFVGPESWLIFDLLGLTGPQDWLLIPASQWPLFHEFRSLQSFGSNLVVVNDLAERGIHLATDFVSRVRSEEQRTALFQVVENYRGRVKKVTKGSLKLC